MRKHLIVILTILYLTGCKKGKKEDPPPPPVTPPSKTSLLFPNKDEACASGNIVSPTESTIIFKWNAAANAESYDLIIKDLETNDKQVKSTGQTELAVTLFRNKPYGWAVVSRSTKTTETAQSDAWKFFNAGPGAVSYPPFPAELLTPAFGQKITAPAGKITLDWNGADADNDIATYDVYFGNLPDPPVLRTNLTESTLAEVGVSVNNTYYWRVITRDKKGNSAGSEVYRFEVH